MIMKQSDSFTCSVSERLSHVSCNSKRSELPRFLLLCQYPDVFGRCGIALDVWMLPVGDDIYQNSVQQPLLFINSEKFQWAENILKIKKLISNDKNKKMITIK